MSPAVISAAAPRIGQPATPNLPAGGATTLATGPSNDTTLELAPVKVTTPVKPAEIRKSEERPKQQLFNWKDGGTILTHVGRHTTAELKFQFNPEHGGLDIISISR